MAEILVIRARLRKRHDRDIQRAVSLLELEEGELSDLVREGFRRVLAERGVLDPGRDDQVSRVPRPR